MIDDLLDRIKLQPLHVHDAKKIRESGILNGSLQSVEGRLRSFINSDAVNPYVYLDDSENIIAFIKLCNYSENRNNLSLHIYTSITDQQLLNNIIDDCLVISFFKLNARKVTTIIDCNNAFMEQGLIENGFTQEAVLHEEFQIEGQYVDAGLFYILRPQYTKYNVLFLPFPRGVVYVGGGIDYVDQVGFFNYEDTIEDIFMRDVGEYLGISSIDGVINKRNSECFSYDFSDLEYVPSEVRKAYQQLIEYFLKKREVFDINVSLANLTDFQLTVLDAVRTIKYGSTLSYEDIALIVTNNDYQKARKLTRAVGNACGSNPVPIIIPCHRVIGKNGMLVGFSGGIEFKDFLLQNEMFESMIPLY